jgi:hypothetical protein
MIRLAIRLKVMVMQSNSFHKEEVDLVSATNLMVLAVN